MKAKELIEILKKHPEAEIITTSSNFELRGALVSVKCDSEPRKVMKKLKQFRDAFDGTSYSTEVYGFALFDEDDAVDAFIL